MFQRESRIIYISSVRSRQPWSMQLMYATGKSAGEALCRTWAEAFGGKDEKVNSCTEISSVLAIACGLRHPTIYGFQSC